MTRPYPHGGNVFAIARACGVPPEEFLDFSASINPLGPPPGVRNAVMAAFERIVHYPDSDCTDLRESIARHHGLSPANICVANGSTELIHLLPRLAKGSGSLVVAPPFSEYAAALGRDGARVDYHHLRPETGFDLSLVTLRDSLRQGYGLLVVTNPGNPSGRLYSPAEIEALRALCREAGTFLVVDEAFIDFCEEGSAKNLAAGDDALLVLRSMTKFYALPGLRLGYAIGTPATIALLSRLRPPWSVGTLAQEAGVASLAATDYADATRELIAHERERLAARLAALPGVHPFPAAANYILVEITTGPPASVVAARLLEKRILIRDCANFCGLNEFFFRVAVRSREENEKLAAALAAALRR